MEYYFVKFNNNKVHNDNIRIVLYIILFLVIIWSKCVTGLLFCIQSWIKRPSEGSTVETVTQNANARKRTEGVHMVAILLYLNSPCSIH